MKFLLKTIVVFIVALVCIAQAEPDIGSMDIIRDIQKGNQNRNAIQKLYVADTATINGTLTVQDAALSAFLIDTNVTISTVIYTPTCSGQILFGVVSSEWYRASGTTTNDWVHLN